MLEVREEEGETGGEERYFMFAQVAVPALLSRVSDSGSASDARTRRAGIANSRAIL